MVESAVHAPGTNPNMPAGDSENMRRVTGEQVEVPPLPPEPGDIWPGPLPPEPTLQELEQQGEPASGQSSRCRARRNSSSSSSQHRRPITPPPAARAAVPRRRGSNQPGLPQLPHPAAAARRATLCRPGAQSGRAGLPDPEGPAVTNGGTSGYQTTTTRRRFGDRRPQWQWHEHDHTFGRHDRDRAHTALSCHG